MDGQALVDHLALRVAKGQVGRLARLQLAAANRLDHGRNVFAGDPHDAHGAAAGRGGDRNNGVVVSGQHGGRC
jgi:hypothetical protein